LRRKLQQQQEGGVTPELPPEISKRLEDMRNRVRASREGYDDLEQKLREMAPKPRGWREVEAKTTEKGEEEELAEGRLHGGFGRKGASIPHIPRSIPINRAKVRLFLFSFSSFSSQSLPFHLFAGIGFIVKDRRDHEGYKEDCSKESARDSRT
jgi:hypothetical protein